MHMKNSLSRLVLLGTWLSTFIALLCGGQMVGSSSVPEHALPTQVTTVDSAPVDIFSDVDRAGDHPSPQASRGSASTPRLVFRDRVMPHWLEGGTRFWYRNDLADGAKEFILVDAAQGARTPAFDQARVAVSLGKAAGKELSAGKLPFAAVEFTADGQAIRFKLDDTVWQCDLQSY